MCATVDNGTVDIGIYIGGWTEQYISTLLLTIWWCIIPPFIGTYICNEVNIMHYFYGHISTPFINILSTSLVDHLWISTSRTWFWFSREVVFPDEIIWLANWESILEREGYDRTVHSILWLPKLLPFLHVTLALSEVKHFYL